MSKTFKNRGEMGPDDVFASKIDHFGLVQNRLCKGGTLTEAKKMHFYEDFLIRKYGLGEACQNPEFHGFSVSLHPRALGAPKMMIFL